MIQGPRSTETLLSAQRAPPRSQWQGDLSEQGHGTPSRPLAGRFLGPGVLSWAAGSRSVASAAPCLGLWHTTGTQWTQVAAPRVPSPRPSSFQGLLWGAGLRATLLRLAGLRTVTGRASRYCRHLPASQHPQPGTPTASSASSSPAVGQALGPFPCRVPAPGMVLGQNWPRSSVHLHSLC